MTIKSLKERIGLRKCGECEDCFYDELDGHLYCRADGRFDEIDDEDCEHEPEWCPKK